MSVSFWVTFSPRYRDNQLAWNAMAQPTPFKTLEQFIIERQEQLPHSTGEFSRLIRDISIAAKVINRDMRRAGIVDIGGVTGEINVQGETQQVMDKLAHDALVEALLRGGECGLIGSEEHAEAIPITLNGNQGKYMVLFDPLDGSSNIEVSVSVGTIFSIYRIDRDTPPGTPVDVPLQPGSQQVAAGYIVYGPSTMLVYTTGHGVNGFTLEPSIGEFLLSHPDIRIPARASLYSINEGNYRSFAPGLRRYLKWLQEEDEATGRPYTTRYIGSFVADVHRNLIKGGIYLYPATRHNPHGKLRLMYEANPMAFIVEQAGGMATDGVQRILDIEPHQLHDRTPVLIGSPALVKEAMQFLSDAS